MSSGHSKRGVWYDCSPPISPSLAVWPGDVPFHHEWNLRLETGSSVNLSSIAATVHLGSHADAPLHYDARGAAIDECDLEVFVGPARVVCIDPGRLDGENRIGAELLIEKLTHTPPRVLVRTGTFDHQRPYDDRFASFHPDAIDLLAARGVVLVGIDTPSVDPLRDETLASHHRLAAHGMLNLEGLVLEHVPEGDYELIALPLRLVGLEASPVRAVLRLLRT